MQQSIMCFESVSIKALYKTNVCTDCVFHTVLLPVTDGAPQTCSAKAPHFSNVFERQLDCVNLHKSVYFMLYYS